MELFSSLKVLDLSSVLAGPLCGSFFRELGAQVIKVENAKTGGDVTRTWKLANEDSEQAHSSYYASANYDKQTLLLDFSDEEDFNTLIGQIKEADIIISNFRSSTEKKYGLSFESIKELNPNILMGKIIGYSSSPNKPAYDVALQAEAGYISMCGTSDKQLAKIPVAMIDILASHQLREGLLCALLLNQQSPQSSLVTVSLMDCALSGLINQASAYLNSASIAKPIGTQHPNIAPYGDLFVCKDHRKILFAIGSNAQWEKLCAYLKLSELAAELNSNQKRVLGRTKLVKQLQDKIEHISSTKIIETCTELEIPIALVKKLDEALDSPDAQELVLEDGFGKRISSKCFQISS